MTPTKSFYVSDFSLIKNKMNHFSKLLRSLFYFKHFNMKWGLLYGYYKCVLGSVKRNPKRIMLKSIFKRALL